MKERDSLITEQSEALLNENNSGPPPVLAVEAKKERLVSLDVLRGLTIAGMLIVDNLMDGPQWAEHPQWNGFTFADLIFPSFLFCMGMAVPLALSKNRPISHKNVFRIFALFGIGVLLNLFEVKFNFYEFRVMGILQRLSLCYGTLSLIHVLTNYGEKSIRFIGVLITSAFSMLYLAFMIPFVKEAEGCTFANNLSPICNFGAYWDRQMFGEHHMIYPSDPEGLFTTFSSFINAYAGYWFCLTMFDNRNNIKKTLLIWAGAASICAITALPLVWLMPLNKKLWSISYAFLTVGISGISLALITLLFDYIGKDNPRYQRILSIVSLPLIWFGRNPLALFMSRDFLDDLLNTYIVINDVQAWKHIYHYLFKIWISNKQVASVMFSLFLLILFFLQAWILFSKSIFIRL